MRCDVHNPDMNFCEKRPINVVLKDNKYPDIAIWWNVLKHNNRDSTWK